MERERENGGENLTKFYPIYPNLTNFHPNLPKFAQVDLKNLLGDASPSSYSTGCLNTIAN